LTQSVPPPPVLPTGNCGTMAPRPMAIRRRAAKLPAACLSDCSAVNLGIFMFHCPPVDFALRVAFICACTWGATRSRRGRVPTASSSSTNRHPSLDLNTEFSGHNTATASLQGTETRPLRPRELGELFFAQLTSGETSTAVNQELGQNFRFPIRTC